MRRILAAVVLASLVSGCASELRPTSEVVREPSSAATSATMGSSESASGPAGLTMPDLRGLLLVDALEELEGVRTRTDNFLRLQLGRAVPVGCEQRPRTVARQVPPPGTPIGSGTSVRIRTAQLDLESSRGPCDPADRDLGTVDGADADLAWQFYRFAADPTLGAPFGERVWVGIEDSSTGAWLSGPELMELDAWQIGTAYAEAVGPFSALDHLASSGGYFQINSGITPTCPDGNRDAPAGLSGMRALSLTSPAESFASCMDWWGVTLSLDGADRIHGVTLRKGSP